MKIDEKPEIKPDVCHLPMCLEPVRLPQAEDSGVTGMIYCVIKDEKLMQSQPILDNDYKI